MIRTLTLDVQTDGTVLESLGVSDKLLKKPDSSNFVWIDITKQTADDLEILAKEFKFHPLAIEDCLHFDQRPKLEEFSGPEPVLFVVLHDFCEKKFFSHPKSDHLAFTDHGEYLLNNHRMQIQPRELHAFIGPNYLVTIHEEEMSTLDSIWDRVKNDAAVFKRGCDFVYYLIADSMCDSNFPILDHLSESLDVIEEEVISSPRKEALSRIYQMRKALILMRRILSPQRDLMAVLARHGGNASITERTALYFRDVYDHLVRINEAIESGRDLLGNCVDAYLSAVSQRTNEIMKQLTILSAVMLPLTFIVGFFGMNFETIIPFHSKSVFISMLVLMFLVVPGGMMVWFYRKRWL